MKFRLATLLLLVAVVALFVSFVVVPQVRRQQAEKAIAKLTRRPDNAKRDDHGNVVELYCGFVETKIDDKVYPIDSKLLRLLPRLEGLAIVQCKFSSFEAISKLNRLDSLGIYDCEVARLDPDLELSVSEFSFGCQFPVDQLPKMPNLDTVLIGTMRSVYYVLVPGEEGDGPMGYPFEDWARYPKLRNLTAYQKVCNGFDGGEKFTALESMYLTRCYMYSLHGIEKIPNLKRLQLGCHWQVGINEASLKSLCECRSLERLELCTEELTPDQLQRVKLALPNCEILH